MKRAGGAALGVVFLIAGVGLLLATAPVVAGPPKIAAGWSYNVVLDSNGKLWAWGGGALGNVSSCPSSFCVSNSKVPVAVDWSNSAAAVAAGEYHTVAVRSDGTVWTWGDNFDGQLGDGTRIDSSLPIPVAGLNDVIAVEAGRDSTFALKADGTLWGWGWGGNGALGNGTGSSSTVPVRVSVNSVNAVAAGDLHGLALRSDGTIWAWGFNQSGQLGGAVTSIWGSDVAVPIPNLVGMLAVAAERDYSVALKSDGTVWTWGDNFYGQLGNGNKTDSAVPSKVAGLTSVREIAAGGTHVVVARSDGTVWTWGENLEGQLGNNSYVDSTVPVQVSGLTGVVAVAAGLQHSLALKADGTLWAWGYNFSGQLGINSKVRSPVPVQVFAADGSGYLNLGVSNPNLISGFDVTTRAVSFSPRGVGTNSAGFLIRLSNKTGRVVTPGVLSIAGDINDFALTADQCSGVPMPSPSTCSFRVTFLPQANGLREAIVQIPTPRDVPALSVELRGIGTVPAVSSAELKFGLTLLGDPPLVKRLTYTNRTPNIMTLAAPQVVGVGAADYGIDASACTRGPLGAGAKCVVTVTFAPSIIGPITALLVLGTDPAVAAPVLVSLTGYGTVSGPVTGFPSVASISPTSGTVGTLVTIKGTGFGSKQGASVVRFGSAPVQVIESWTNTTLKIRAPVQEEEVAAVFVQTSVGQSAFSRSFVYTRDGDRCREVLYFLRNKNACNLVGKLREPQYFGITLDEVSNNQLLAYVQLHQTWIEQLILEVDNGREVSRFLGGAVWSSSKESAVIQGLDLAADSVNGTILPAILTYLGENASTLKLGLASHLWGEFLSTANTISSGIETYKTLAGLLGAAHQRAVLQDYVIDRCGAISGRCNAGMTRASAWSDVSSTFSPLIDETSLLRNIPLVNMPTYYEHLFQSLRMTAYDDSVLYRESIGQAVAHEASKL